MFHSQTPVNLVQAKVNRLLKYPKFTTQSGGCNKWAQFADDHAFQASVGN